MVQQYLKKHWMSIVILVLLGGLLFIFDRNFFVIPKSRAVQKQEKVDFIEKKVFGKSVEGRDIEGYVIGSGKNTTLLFGAIHGNEMGTAELLRQLVLEISLNRARVSQNNTLIVIPIANPDGYYDRTDNLNANRVNPNLNFLTSDWKKYGPEGTYAGPQPFSENESQAIRVVVEHFKPSMMISFHSHGNLISPETIPASIALAQWYSKKSGYKYFDEWDYPGTATKWFEETTGNPAITVELSADLQSDWEINKAVLFELISSDVGWSE